MGQMKARLMDRLEHDPVFRERYDREDDEHVEPCFEDKECPFPPVNPPVTPPAGLEEIPF